MYVTKAMIDEVISQFGAPQKASFEFTVSENEFRRIKSSQKHGRKHDITLYIFKEDSIIVIAKPFYPPGLYRAPSGGLRPEEPFIAGALRETWEETGCRIEIEHFLLHSNVHFVGQNGIIDWTSFVMQARYIGGDFQFTDHEEIREVRLALLDEFKTFSRIMRSTDFSGLHYRAALHEAVEPLLVR